MHSPAGYKGPVTRGTEDSHGDVEVNAFGPAGMQGRFNMRDTANAQVSAAAAFRGGYGVSVGSGRAATVPLHSTGEAHSASTATFNRGETGTSVGHGQASTEPLRTDEDTQATSAQTEQEPKRSREDASGGQPNEGEPSTSEREAMGRVLLQDEAPLGGREDGARSEVILRAREMFERAKLSEQAPMGERNLQRGDKLLPSAAVERRLDMDETGETESSRFHGTRGHGCRDHRGHGNDARVW